MNYNFVVPTTVQNSSGNNLGAPSACVGWRWWRIPLGVGCIFFFALMISGNDDVYSINTEPQFIRKNKEKVIIHILNSRVEANLARLRAS